VADEPHIRASAPGDLDAALAMLSAADLPVDDLDSNKFENFLVALVDGSVAGLIGLERFGRVALLRSLVVAPGNRDAGLGRRLVSELEARAAAAGVRDIWLLTIDAASWFETADFVRCERSEAPEAIAATEEFASLCPGSAVLMKKSL
jgi:amino-acid N-acetyltransferase